jgi:hypothetical protein
MLKNLNTQLWGISMIFTKQLNKKRKMKSFEANPELVLESYKSGTDSDRKLLVKIFGNDSLEDNEWKNLFKEFCKESGLNYDALMEKWEGEEDDEIAYKMIKRILKYRNKDWVANIKDKSQKKWYPVFLWDEQSGFGLSDTYCTNAHSYAYVGSRLYSSTQDIAVDVAKKYTPIYKKFHTYL